MTLLSYALLLLVLPLIIIRYISSREGDGYHSNSWWGLLGWVVGAFTTGTILMPFLWIDPMLAMLFYLIYTPLWGFATTKIINGIIIGTSWYPERLGKSLVGLGVGLFVATSLNTIGKYVSPDFAAPLMQLCMYIVGIASGIGAGIMSMPLDTRPYN